MRSAYNLPTGEVKRDGNKKYLVTVIQTPAVYLSGIQLFNVLLFPQAEHTYPFPKGDNQKSQTVTWSLPLFLREGQISLDNVRYCSFCTRSGCSSS